MKESCLRFECVSSTALSRPKSWREKRPLPTHKIGSYPSGGSCDMEMDKSKTSAARRCCCLAQCRLAIKTGARFVSGANIS